MEINKNDLLHGAVVGTIAGVSVALGGAVKDAPHEGFKPVTFFRSPTVGMVAGILIKISDPKIDDKSLFFASIGLERFIVESWKILRVKIPSKFEIGEWGSERPVKVLKKNE